MPALLSVTLQPVWAEEEMLQSEDVNSEYGIELALSSSDYVMIDSKKVLNVGEGKLTDVVIGLWNESIATDDSFTVGDRKDEQGNIIKGDCDMIGLVKDGKFVSYDVLDDKTKSTTTKNLMIGKNGDKDLTIYGSGQVVLGGQLMGEKKGLFKTEKYDFYQGITANKITVAGDGSVTNLEVSNAELNELEVQSGKAVLHDGGNIRNGYKSNLEDSSVDKLTTNKQVLIRKKVTVSGGELQLGSDSDLDKVTGQYLTALGCNESAATMIQSGDSTIGVYGYSIAQAGLTIVQAEGEMTFRDRLDIKGNGTNTIWQGYAYDNAGNLTEVKHTVTTTENPMASKITFGDLGKGTYAINQANEGTIQIDKVAGGTFNISQEGKGNIVFGSGFDNATVNVSKSTGTLEFKSDIELSSLTKDGGAIEVAEGATLTADSLNWNLVEKQTKDAGSDIEISGSVSLKSGEIKNVTSENGAIFVTNTGKLTADTVNVNAGSLKMDGNGSLSAGKVNAAGVAMNGNKGNVALYDGAISTEGSTVTNSGTLAADSISVATGNTLKNDEGAVIVVGTTLELAGGAKLVNNGIISGSSAYALMTTEDQAEAVLGGTIILNEGSEVLNAGKIENDILVNGGTLTLNQDGSTQNITMTAGEILVTGNNVQTGSLTLDGGTINFEAGAMVNLKDDATLTITKGTTIMVTVSTEMLENLAGQDFKLFGGNVENITNATFIFTDGDQDTSNDVTDVTISLGGTSGSIKVEIQAVPEPTTATLSLLALVGLAARRRRK